MEERETMESTETTETTEATENTPKKEWYVDMNREEYAAFRLLLARVNGPLRMRIPTLVMSLLCSGMMLVLALGEWLAAGREGPVDVVTLVCGVLVLAPALYLFLVLPHSLRKQALRHHDRCVSAGMVFSGQLNVTPEYVEKVGPTATAHIPMDERVLFIENQELMVFFTPTSPALVLPGRCLTDEMATAIRRAADSLPPQNRRFIARVQCGGAVVTPVEAVKPEQLWTATFTYTHEEFVTVMRGSVLSHFRRMAPLLTAVATLGALIFGWDGSSMMPCIGYFLMFMGIMLLLNLVFPLLRLKGRVYSLSAHDLTMKVTFDTTALRIQAPKSGENWVLWCDIPHVYDKDPFAEIVMEKHNTLMIPKRAIPDLAAFEAALARCRGKK